MISPVIFAGALTIVAGALPRGRHPGDGAASDWGAMENYWLIDQQRSIVEVSFRQRSVLIAGTVRNWTELVVSY